MSNTINKYDVKQMAYDAHDAIEKELAKLNCPGCDTDETGRLRAEVTSILRDAMDKLKSTAYNIY